ncbi:MAG: ribosome-associated translation inhibitor RaiA [Lentisphaerae bacterium]|nr:ribosome-associated translation inhibitor RaiA [Lentisphaerota bacterium]
MDATVPLQDYARRKAEAVMEIFSRVEHVHVILDVQRHLSIAEAVVQAKNHIRTEAREESDNMQASIDGAFDKIERQLRRRRDKVQDHRPRAHV